jgi:hypothetical protein
MICRFLDAVPNRRIQRSCALGLCSLCCSVYVAANEYVSFTVQLQGWHPWRICWAAGTNAQLLATWTHCHKT